MIERHSRKKLRSFSPDYGIRRLPLKNVSVLRVGSRVLQTNIYIYILSKLDRLEFAACVSPPLSFVRNPS